MQLLSVYVGKPQTVSYQNREVTTSIFKTGQTGPVQVNALNLAGDQQADLRVHGGPDKAVYAYPAEHYTYWQTARSELDFGPGTFGENLSISGLLEEDVCIGDRYQIGTAQFQVTSPRMPCFKLGIKMQDPRFVKDFMDANKTGFYFKVLQEGTLTAGDPISLLHKDSYGLRVSEVSSLYSTHKENKQLLHKAAHAPALPADWADFFADRLHKLTP